MAFAGRWGQTEEHRAAGGRDPVGDQDRLGPGAGVVAKAGPVQVQVVQVDLGQAPGRPGGELAPMASQIRLTLERLTAAWGPSASARLDSTSRVLSPRTNPAMTKASSALVRVT